MRKLLLFIAGSVIALSTASGQSDPAAVKVLDKFSAAASSAPSVSMKFLMVTVDQMEKTTDSLTGSVLLCRDSYKLDLPENIIWFDGQTSWSYLPAEQEVTITKPSKKDNSFQSQPSLIFSMYKKGYKTRLVEEKPDSFTIDLYPVDIKTDMIRVRLIISKPSHTLKSVEYKKRDGVTSTLIISEYDLTKIPEAGIFTFPAEKYKNAEIVDMR